MLAPLVLLAVLGADASEAWSPVELRDGVQLETRKVKGSHFLELRLRAVSAKTVGALCDEAWGDGKFDPTEPDLQLRTLLQEAPTERVVYEQITPPIVSKRDYALRFTVTRDEASCVVRYETANELAPPVPAGFVRIEHLYGIYTFTAAPEGTRVSWVSYADPAGALPAFLTEGGRTSESISRLKLLMARAKPATP